jgi:hypothetical protein
MFKPIPFTEEEVIFLSGEDDLFGILTLPAEEDPFPAIVLLYGSDP